MNYNKPDKDKKLETHKLLFGQMDKELKIIISRKDSLVKIIITISSGVIAFVVPLFFDKLQNLNSCNQYFFYLSIIGFFITIFIFLISWNYAIHIDSKGVENYKKQLYYLGVYGYNAETEHVFSKESKRIGNEFKKYIEPRKNFLEILNILGSTFFYVSLLLLMLGIII